MCFFACSSCHDSHRNRTVLTSQTSAIGSSGGGVREGEAEREREYPLDAESSRGSGMEWGAAGNIGEDRLGGFLLPSGYEMSLMLRFRLGVGARHGQVSALEGPPLHPCVMPLTILFTWSPPSPHLIASLLSHHKCHEEPRGRQLSDRNTARGGATCEDRGSSNRTPLPQPSPEFS